MASIPESILGEWHRRIGAVLRSGCYIGGSVVSEFEAQFAEHCQIEHCVGVANGLDAITLALEALGAGPGHQIAVPAHTFIATWLAVLRVGARPVGVDVTQTGQIDVAKLEQMTSKMDFVIPVHMHGGTVDMPRLMEWAKETGALVVEDCAQAHGATIEGRSVGTWGDAGAFSFYPTKNLGAVGDAGAIITADPQVASRIRSLGNYGSSAGNKYAHTSLGWNSRLDPAQAAVLSINLTNLERWTLRRREIAQCYLAALDNGCIGLSPLISDPEASVWHHFVVLHKDRDRIREVARAAGIETEIHYPIPAAREVSDLLGESNVGHRNAEQIAEQSFSIPIYPWLRQDQVSLVCSFLRGG